MSASFKKRRPLMLAHFSKRLPIDRSTSSSDTLAAPLAIIMHAMLRHGTEFEPV